MDRSTSWITTEYSSLLNLQTFAAAGSSESVAEIMNVTWIS